MRALFDDASVLQHEDLIRGKDRGETVGDQDTGAGAHQRVDGSLDRGLRDGIQGGCRLVKDQQRRVLEQDAGYGDPLALAAGQSQAPVSHEGVKALRQTAYHAEDIGFSAGIRELLFCGIRFRVEQSRSCR